MESRKECQYETYTLKDDPSLQTSDLAEGLVLPTLLGQNLTVAVEVESGVLSAKSLQDGLANLILKTSVSSASITDADHCNCKVCKVCHIYPSVHLQLPAAFDFVPLEHEF